MAFTPGGMGISLVLSQIRSAVRVGLALVESCPTEEAWDALLADPETHETLNELALLIQDVHARAEAAGGSYDATLDSLTTDHMRAVECLEPFCEKLGVPPDDFLNALAAS